MTCEHGLNRPHKSYPMDSGEVIECEGPQGRSLVTEANIAVRKRIARVLVRHFPTATARVLNDAQDELLAAITTPTPVESE